MGIRVKYVITTLCLFFLLSLSIASKAQVQLLSVPQQAPDTRLLRKNYKIWEKSLPFDGLALSFNDNTINTKESDGYYGRSGNELTFSVFNNNKTIRFNDYSNAILDLKACRFSKLKNNFMMISLFPNNWIAWDDDAGWNHLLNNLSNSCKIASAGGLKGIVLDTEMYGSPQSLNLTFYCQQFTNKLYTKNSKIAYVRINGRNENDDINALFPGNDEKIYWKGTDDLTGDIKLKLVFLNIYKDNSDNYYYPLIDPQYKSYIQFIIKNVEKRGQQLISVINKDFKDAQIILTVGPSNIYNDLKINGLTSSHCFYRSGYGLLVPLVKGMLQKINFTGITLTDGQEQSYYFKNKSQFTQVHNDFMNANRFFKADNVNYIKNMHEGIALFPRLADPNNHTERFFYPKEITNAFKFASLVPKIKYIWVYEENQSFWYLNNLNKQYLNKDIKVSIIDGNNLKKVR